MKKTNTFSGKVIAVIMVLVFLGINYFKSENEAGPQEQRFAKAKHDAEEYRRLDNKISKPQDIKKLQYAYTGKWEKNDLTKQDGKFAFNTPESTRNTMEATAAKKAEEKKKKLAKKNKKTKNKVARKMYNSKSRFARDEYDSGFQDTPAVVPAYYGILNPQARTPSDEEKDKKLAAKEWFDKITTENSISNFLSEHNKGTVDTTTFYAVAEMLLSSDKESNKKFGYQVIQSVPSLKSLDLYAKHVKEEMSAELKTFAQSTLNAYTDPSDLKILNSALKSANDDLKIIAAVLIKDITTEILEAQNAGAEGVVYTEIQLQNFRTMLTASLNVINAALATNLSAEVIASFNTTRTVLMEFLS